MPSGPNSRWNSSAAAVTAPTLTWSARTRKKPVVSTDTSPTASAMFMVEANRKNARMAVSAASTARREARSTTAVCRASIPYACTVGAPCRTFITCWVRSPAATRSFAYSGPGRRQEPPQPERVHREDEQEGQRQPPVQGGEADEGEHHGDQRGEDPGGHPYGGVDQLDVLGDPGGDVAGAGPLQGRGVHPQRLVDHLLAQVGGHGHAELVAVTPRHRGQHPGGERGHHEQHHQQAEPGPVAVQHDVDDVAEQQRYDDPGRRRPATVSSRAAQASRRKRSTWCQSFAAARRPVAIGSAARGPARPRPRRREHAHRSTAAA